MSQVVPKSRRSARARGGRIAILIGLVVVLAGACALLVTLVLPPLVTNATARVETSDTTVEAGRASIVVPAGWAVRRPVLSSPDALLITSPDGNLDVTLSPSARAPREAFSEVAPAVAGPIEETLGSGLTSVHAKTADGSITAAIGDDDGSAIVVAVAEGDIQRYTCALAELIESARVHPDQTAGAP